MKKFLLFVMAFFMIMPVTVNAQSKSLEKELKKEYKKKIKEYKKENWKLFGSSRTVEVALLKHYDKLNNLEDGKEIVGLASNFKSKNVGMQMSINNACLTYAQSAGSYVKGRVMSDLFGDGTTPDKEFDKFYAAYERLVESEIKGEMEKSYSVIKDNGDGTFELQTYFIISESEATKARIRAFENAAKETELAQKYGEKVAEFIKEGFETE